MAYTILYLENDKIAREAFAGYFKRKHYEVHAFENSSDAEEALKTIKPHVIIADQKLGDNSLGWEFLKKSIALSPMSVRFILSGYSESELILSSFREGAIFDYISKSASNSEIELKIKNACLFYESINNEKSIDTKEDLLLRVIALTKELKTVKDQLAEITKLKP